MTEVATFVCSICNDPCTDICVFCTKDTCRNHRCDRCKRCSDCCECDVPLTSPEPVRVPVLVTSDPKPFAALEPDLETLPAPPEASEEPDLGIPSALPVEHAAEEERELPPEP